MVGYWDISNIFLHFVFLNGFKFFERFMEITNIKASVFSINITRTYSTMEINDLHLCVSYGFLWHNVYEL